jgi:hypothetical protein
MKSVLIKQLNQLKTITWDGNLMSKGSRDALVELGMVARHQGWNFLTQKGVQQLIEDAQLLP